MLDTIRKICNAPFAPSQDPFLPQFLQSSLTGRVLDKEVHQRSVEVLPLRPGTDGDASIEQRRHLGLEDIGVILYASKQQPEDLDDSTSQAGAFILEDLLESEPDMLTPLQDLRSPIQPNKDFVGNLLLPLVDGSLAARTGQIVLTKGSTFSSYVKYMHERWGKKVESDGGAFDNGRGI